MSIWNGYWKHLPGRLFPGYGQSSARKAFADNGLAFPAIPAELGKKLRRRQDWQWCNQAIPTPPYFIQAWVEAFQQGDIEELALLAHDGHGVNSHALQYYLVHDGLALFLHLAWGGVYMDQEASTRNVNHCLSLADQIVERWQSLPGHQRRNGLLVVAADFYPCWCRMGDRSIGDAEHGEPGAYRLLQAVASQL
jgi:hypothetical protein